jgi:hypothetical protein
LLGNQLYDCSRGSNHAESHHKGLVTTFGTWQAGVEMAHHLLAEHRHRCNQRTSELRRPCYPKLGMYDTWIIDALQIVLGTSRGTLLYPEWFNTSEFAPTPESFGTVPLQSAALGAAIESIALTEDVKLTRELTFIAKAMGCKLPPLPVTGEKECALFNRLVLLNRGAKFDSEQVAIDWCKYVNPRDGIFPKLPVYLRLHYAECAHNIQVRNAVIAASAASTQLEQLNRRTAPAARPALPPAPAFTLADVRPAPTVAMAVAAPAHAGRGLAAAIACPLAPPGSASDLPLELARPLARASVPTGTASSFGIVPATPLPRAPAEMRATAVPMVVGGFVLAPCAASAPQQRCSTTRREPGQRAADTKKREARKCQACGRQQGLCSGATRGRSSCQHTQAQAPAAEAGGSSLL